MAMAMAVQRGRDNTRGARGRASHDVVVGATGVAMVGEISPKIIEEAAAATITSASPSLQAGVKFRANAT